MLRMGGKRAKDRCDKREGRWGGKVREEKKDALKHPECHRGIVNS